MNCPHCSAWTMVKLTRGVRRRRECANGHRFSTIEVPAELIEDQQARALKEERLARARRVLRERGYLR